MPFYEYECPSCKYYAEVLQRISEQPLKKCPSCGKAGFKKLVSAPVFRLKGSGWYETDFKGESDTKRNLAGAEHETPAAETKATGEPKPAADAKAGTEVKGEGKGAAESKPAADAKGEGKGAKDSKAAANGGSGKQRGSSRSAARRPTARASAKRKPARPGKRR